MTLKRFTEGARSGCLDPPADHSRDTDTETPVKRTHILGKHGRTQYSPGRRCGPWNSRIQLLFHDLSLQYPEVAAPSPSLYVIIPTNSQKGHEPERKQRTTLAMINKQIQARNQTCRPAVFQTLSRWNTAVTKGLRRNVPDTLASRSKRFCLQKHNASYMCAFILPKNHIKIKTDKIILIHFT